MYKYHHRATHMYLSLNLSKIGINIQQRLKSNLPYYKKNMGRAIQYPSTLTDPAKKLIYDASLLSWLAYSSPDDLLKNWSDKSYVDQYEVLKRVSEIPLYITCPSCDAQCYLVKYHPPEGLFNNDKPTLAICARGSTSLMDWMCDGDVVQRKFKDASDNYLDGVYVHSGFYEQFIGLFSIFDKQVKKHLDDGGNLLCSAHSLGSSVCALAALNYGSIYPSQVFYVGFGTPRVGNKAFADKFNKCVGLKLRIKNNRDPVSCTPPPINFHHVGEEYHLGPPDPLPDIPILLDVGDHYIQNYVKHLLDPDTAYPTAKKSTHVWYQDIISRWL